MKGVAPDKQGAWMVARYRHFRAMNFCCELVGEFGAVELLYMSKYCFQVQIRIEELYLPRQLIGRPQIIGIQEG